MDGIWLEDTTELEHQIREMMAHQALPPEVVGYDVEFGTHWFGDPAVWLNLHIPEDAPADWDMARKLSEVITDTSVKLKHLVPHRLSSARISRPPSDQR